MLTNFSKEDISEYLIKVSQCIDGGRAQIALNNQRKKNIDFLARYNLTVKDAFTYIKGLDVNDFCYGLKNDTNNPRFQHEILYVFSKTFKLEEAGIEKAIETYIKFNLIEMESNRLITISFHELEQPIKQLFK